MILGPDTYHRFIFLDIEASRYKTVECRVRKHVADLLGHITSHLNNTFPQKVQCFSLLAGDARHFISLLTQYMKVLNTIMSKMPWAKGSKKSEHDELVRRLQLEEEARDEDGGDPSTSQNTQMMLPRGLRGVAYGSSNVRTELASSWNRSGPGCVRHHYCSSWAQRQHLRKTGTHGEDGEDEMESVQYEHDPAKKHDLSTISRAQARDQQEVSHACEQRISRVGVGDDSAAIYR